MADGTAFEEAAAYPSPAPTRSHYVGLPQAAVRIAQHTDGRWMWAISYYTNEGGEGSAPLAKWGRFAPTRDAARKAGIEELQKRLDQRCWSGRHFDLLRAWVREAAAPKQLDLI